MSPSPDLGDLCLKEMPNDPYALLGLKPGACDAWIRSAFRRTSLQVHPDRCPDDPDAASRFRNLLEAKELLLNPLRRRIYDTTHGIKAKQVAPEKWWIDWDGVFAELDSEKMQVDPNAADPAQGNLEDSAAASIPAPITLLTATGWQADILVVGATGLTGMMACMLLEKGLAGRTWAIAGRDGRKLQMLEAKFGHKQEYQGAIKLEAAEDILTAVRAARVVVDLTGPSYSTGHSVAEACALTGRHYVDNTTELAFSKGIKDKYHAQAKASGACLVMHAGDTSLIADFGTWHLARFVRDKYRSPLRRVEMFEWSLGLNPSGTNFLSASTGGYWAGENTKGLGFDPFFLGGVRGTGVREEDKETSGVVENKEYGVYCFQCTMVDRLVVRATAGLMDSCQPYGRRFHFNNWVPWIDKESATAAQFKSMLVQKKVESFVQENKIPPAGQGPNESMRRERLMTRVFVGTTDEMNPKTQPRTAHVVLSAGPGGLGCRVEGTAALTLEAATALLDAEDAGKKRMLKPGWGTPVYHLAHLGGFMERLQARGLRLCAKEGAPPPELLRNIVNSTLPLEF